MATAAPSNQEGRLALHRIASEAFVDAQRLATPMGRKIIAILFEVRKLG